MSIDIAALIRDWPHDDEGIAARLVRAADGSEWLQMRLHMGVLQMALDGRPDGHRPGGFASLLDRYRALDPADWDEFDEADFAEITRELLQFYHRRVSLLAVGGQYQARGDTGRAGGLYRRAIRDAEHNLDILDLIAQRCGDPERIESHEQHRAYILWHRTLARVQLLLLHDRHDEAVEQIKAGAEEIETLARQAGREEPALMHLRRLERKIRRQHRIEKTLSEQLAAAVANEQYEQAARLRDEITARGDALPSDHR